MKESYYNQIYSSNEKVFGGGRPEGVVIKAIELLPKGANVVEFGAGQGRNALAIAEKGFDVTAIDTSTKGIEFIEKQAEAKKLGNLKVEVGDVLDGIDKDYDLIVTTFMLHHLKDSEARKFIDNMREHTKKGGLNAISTFTKEGDFYKLEPQKGTFLPDLGELKDLYSDWQIIEYSEENSLAKQTHPDGSPMFNIKATILARKPV